MEIGDRTRAELSAVHSGRRFLLSLGALLARRIGRAAAVDAEDEDVEAFDCCELINRVSLCLKGPTR